MPGEPKISPYWQSVLRESDGDDESWVHLWAGEIAWNPGCLDALLRLVADERAGDVLIAPRDFAWLYHPYDGGGDVVATSTAQRDALRERYAEWLSARPDGL